jgi:hypothetical protein
MKNSLQIILVFLLIFSCTEKNKTFEINGTLSNIPDSTNLIISSYEKGVYFKSSIVMNGKFKINDKIEKPTKVYLTIPYTNDSKSFWLENSIITFNAEKGKFNEAQITGSETQQTETIILDKVEIVIKKMEYLEELSKNSRNHPNNFNVKKADSIKKEYDKLIEEKKLIYQDFVRNHPNSIVSADILNMNTREWSREIVSELFNKFPKQNKESIYGKKINEFLTSDKYN